MTRPPSQRHPLFARLYWLQGIWEPTGLARHRRAVARGVVSPSLEIGVGTGFSLRHYREAPFAACDPNLAMLQRARRRAHRLGLGTAFVAARGEALPFRNGTFATTVSQVVLCTVDDPTRVGAEIRRVLDPNGHHRSVEHGLASRPGLARFQRRITAWWCRWNGGCRLDREIVGPLEAAGLVPERVRRCSGGTVVRGTYAPQTHDHDGIEAPR